MIFPHIIPAHLLPTEQPLELPTPIYGAMLSIWQLRPSLQRWFPLHKDKIPDYVRFLGWCVLHGRREYVALREIPDWDALLNMPASLPALKGDLWGPTFTVGMFLMGVARHRNTISHLIGSASERRQMAIWYWRGRRHDSHMPGPPDWQLALLKKVFTTPEGFVTALRRPKNDAGKASEKLVHAYGLEDAIARMDALPDEISLPPKVNVNFSMHWRMAIGKLPLQLTKTWKLVRYRLTSPPSEAQVDDVVKRIPTVQAEQALSRAALREGEVGTPWPDRMPIDGFHPGSLDLPFGVNLFGYAKGELGIGEDVRMFALALHAVGVPFCIINVQPGSDVSQLDTSSDGWLSHQPQYAINLFCMTGIEQVRFLCERGTSVFKGRYTIGLWPWELPAWPRSWAHAYATVNEIWGISRYTADAYRNAPVPVHVMPLAINAKPVADMGRAQFGLPEDSYLFFYAFDFNSTLARKNPEGVIDAFQKAFQRQGGRAVGLVLKVSHVRGHDRRWKRLLARIKSDPRIHLIDHMLRRPELLALYRCCDCFVSLHRSEGFGRTIAEALLLDRQVICTGYSGNIDFCKPERVALVRFKLRPLKAGEYFYHHEQSWAEPSIDHAAELMSELMQRPFQTVNAGFDHGFSAAGLVYKGRLEAIYRQVFCGVSLPA